ncbi:MAG: FG-GAP repeat protein [Phycisphaerales bacterium]|nr:MAG: FG-GAP repeat protein [Phycisphaerales bacterium]
MKRFISVKTCLGAGVALGFACWVAVGLVSCGGAPTPFVVQGPGVTGNAPPELTFVEPSANLTLGQGDNFVVTWVDTDLDSNASIAFWLNSVETSDRYLLEEGIPEDDQAGIDSRTYDTVLIPLGRYNVQAIIDDGVNTPVTAYARSTATGVDALVELNVTPPGQGPQTQPPVITVTEPSFNLSVAQDDILTVAVQPTAGVPAEGISFDADSSVTVYVVLDTDLDPNNDDPANPDSSIIVLRSQVLQPETWDAIEYRIPINLDTVPPRDDGEPYYVRVTADDLVNPRVHQYAVGKINVVQLAAGLVDLYDIGRTKSGARFYGFTPGAWLGSSMGSVSDFDADGIADFVLVAQYGNPRNFGPVGEAYGIYGREGLRFGGALSVNSISETISGVIFTAPPVRDGFGEILDSSARTDGISDVTFIEDLSGDGRPEIMFGLQHVHGAWESMDWDPGDNDVVSVDETEDVTMIVRQGLVEITVGDETASGALYTGVVDLTLAAEFPNSALGSDSRLNWQNAEGDQRQWTLIKFENLLNLIPDGPENIDVGQVNATLEFRVFETGGEGTVHQAISDFDSLTTYADYAVGGGDPVANVDYLTEGTQAAGLGTIDAGNAETVQVDVSELVRELLDGLLTPYDNDLRFIIVADDEEGEELAAVRSSEFSITADRPTLRIEYTRTGVLTEFACYPDFLVNNYTDEADDNEDDWYYYGGGMVAVINSQNRDSAGVINTDRLEDTVVDLELAGARVQQQVLLEGQVLARADNSQAGELGDEQTEEERISGFRIVAGGFDHVDANFLNQEAREGLFGQAVASLGDQDNDGLDEIMISAPRNERYLVDLFSRYGVSSTHWMSTRYRGSITIIPGANYNDNDWRDKSDSENGTSILPFLDQHIAPPYGQCLSPPTARQIWGPADHFFVYAEGLDDMLGGARSAGDFNQDGLDDILCGAPLNDRSASLSETGAVYVLYGRNVIGDFRLYLAEDSMLRPPMLRVRGVKSGDRIGWTQEAGLDVNGDRVGDVFISSPSVDFGGITRGTCAGDYNGDGEITASDLNSFAFVSCEDEEWIFSDQACKAYDYDNDGDVDDADDVVFRCLLDGGGDECCDNLVDNGFVAVIFGGVFTDGDRDITQIATTDLPGVVFFGGSAGDRAGMDVSSAGDFNEDGFGDVLITVPGEVRLDTAGRERLGVVYLIFGGTHLRNTTWNLSQVGSEDLPGIVFISPYTKGRPNEAAPESVAYIGDINQDGYGDIAIGNKRADFVDLSFPQGPDATDSQVGRRSDAGDVYIVYGNNFGTNRGGGGS